jgi:hypothetical protein
MPEKDNVKKALRWGNSVLFLNVKRWKCDYCGLLIKDDTKFCVTLIDGNPEPFILCSKQCLRIYVEKLEAKSLFEKASHIKL